MTSLPWQTAVRILRMRLCSLSGHAEKPDHGVGLSPAGMAHANAYVRYFKNYKIDSVPIKLDTLFAAADSESSHRPRLTLEPLSQSLGVPINSRFKDNDYLSLADALQSANHGRCILICWHHGHIADIMRALGADPGQVLSEKKWPGDEYDWVIQLRYDQDGHLKEAKCIEEMR